MFLKCKIIRTGPHLQCHTYLTSVSLVPSCSQCFTTCSSSPHLIQYVFKPALFLHSLLVSVQFFSSLHSCCLHTFILRPCVLFPLDSWFVVLIVLLFGCLDSLYCQFVGTFLFVDLILDFSLH